LPGETIVVKGVDERAYRRLKSKAAKEGLTMGQAASLAFSAWSERKGEIDNAIMSRSISDSEKILEAARLMDEVRSKLKVRVNWSSERVIREWRDKKQR
jgi:hypothetical protein